MSRYPLRLLGDLEDACATQLDEVRLGVGMCRLVKIYKVSTLAGAFEREGD